MIIHIGFDDIDSPKGGCTTHLVSKLLLKWIKERKIELIDYPNLIRLNPSVPWKTRGNGSVVIRLRVSNYDKAIDLFEEAVEYTESYTRAYYHPQHQPAIGLYMGEISNYLKWLGRKAVNDIVPLDLLFRILSKDKNRIMWKSFGNKKRGLVGVFSGIGNRLLEGDYTFELIAYRVEENYGKPRKIDLESIKEIDKQYGEDLILNFDYEINRPLIIPHGPDPVLFGLRGEEPEVLRKSYQLIKPLEPIEQAVIYRTNQHTDQHLAKIPNLSKAYPYRGVWVRVWVYDKPKRIIGGHVLLKVTDGERIMDAAAYEPTGGFRNIVEKLHPGDEIELLGMVRPPSSIHPATINIEKIHIVTVKPIIRLENPKCPICGARMKSMGRGKGFKCPKCGYRSTTITKTKKIIPRDLEPGWYEPPPRAFKHLMKPIKRFGKEKQYFPKIYKPKQFIWIDKELVY